MTDAPKKTRTVKASLAEHADWEAAAAACDMSVHAWMVAMLNIASGRSSLAAHAGQVKPSDEGTD